MTTAIPPAAASEGRRVPRPPLPPPRSAPDAPPPKVTVIDDRLRIALHELLHARNAGPESTARQQRRAEDTLICLLYPHALSTANIVAQGSVSTPELARRISAILTTTIRDTTARTPDELVRQLLIDIHRRFTPDQGPAIPALQDRGQAQNRREHVSSRSSAPPNLDMTTPHVWAYQSPGGTATAV